SKSAKSHTRHLTPEGLASFYQQVGGNYDSIFLSTPPASLSFIYQKLGCFHSLQPTCDAFEPPSVPAMLPHGFVRWQTIQLLLCPEDHSRFLQEAVRKFDIVNPVTKDIFPKDIPQSVFPAEPDPEIVEWHESLSKKLEHDFWASNAGIFPGSSTPQNGQSRKRSGNSRNPSQNSHDYFSKKNSSRSAADVPPRMPARDKNSQHFYPHDQNLSPLNENSESAPQKNRRRPRQESPSSVRETHSSQSFRRGRPPPLAEGRRGRSCTPNRRRWRREHSTDSSDSPNSSESTEYLFVRRRRPQARHMEPPGVRRHSHDAGGSRQRDWSRSPPRTPTYTSKEERHSHPPTRKYYYSHVHADNEEGPRGSPAPRYYPHQERYANEFSQDYQYPSHISPAPTRKSIYPNPPPPVTPMPPRPKEYHNSQPSYPRPDPVAPSFCGRRNSHSQAPSTTSPYSRYVAPQAPMPYAPSPPSSRRNSKQKAPGKGQSRVDPETTYTVSSSAKYQPPAPGSNRRYRRDWE
ncbi:hypothetical protein LOY94_003498, partial [Ophidiomyces ophidiicola]